MIVARHAVRHRRRGAILLVVLALLALFAVIGLSFVLYAESEATSSRIYREKEDNRARTKPDPTAAAGLAVGQLVYGTVDPTSAVRGHDLARLMYGVNGTVPYSGQGLFHEPLVIPTSTGNILIDRAEVLYHGVLLFDQPGSPTATPGSPVTAAVVDPEFSQGNGQVRNGNLFPTNTVPAESTLTAAPWVYVPKNAPYTYPDRTNVMVAAADPTTGRVFIPSAHRPTLFFPTATANNWFGDLTAGPNFNANWIAPKGRLKLLRPRRIDNLTSAERTTLRQQGLWPVPADIDTNPALAAQRANLAALLSDGPTGLGKFPYPTPNPDGSVTGDVPNVRYAAGVQRNDSVWLDAGLPTQDYKGKRLAPLVAVTLLPLDGRINLNAAGNRKSATGTHTSNMGFGPHEINPGAVLVSAINADTFTQTKYGGATTPAAPGMTTASKVFSTVEPSAASQVDWDATATAASWLALPGSTTAPNGLASAPTYTVTPSATAAANHPTLWTATGRAAFGTSDPDSPGQKGFPLTDLRLFAGRYSGKATDYSSQTFLTNSNRPAAFTGEFAGGAGLPQAQSRAQVTPFSVGMAKAGLAANWFGDPGQSLVYSVKTAGPVRAEPLSGTAGPSTDPRLDIATLAGLPATAVPFSDERQRPGPVTNPTPNQLRLQNLRAALGAVNLNRPLADYRLDPTKPLADNTGGVRNVDATKQPYRDAAIDRQKLAEDIFLRLAVATGAKIAFDPSLPATGATAGRYGQYVLPQPTTTPGTYTLTVNGTDVLPAPSEKEYDALRWLAQLAANIVDYIDPDDISTPFVWNADPTTPPTFASIDDPQYTAAFDISAAPPIPTQLSQRVVFGTEKPRLVLNEVYAEIANDPSDTTTPGTAPTKEFQVRFFLELLAPNTPELNTAHPLAYPDTLTGTTRGAVPLKVYDDITLAGSPYRVEVYNNSTLTTRTAFLTELSSNQNVTGSAPTAAGLPKIDAPLNTLTVPGNSGLLGVLADRLEANNGAAAAFAPAPTDGRRGITLVGPTFIAAKNSTDKAFIPDPTGTPTAADPTPAMLQVPGDDASVPAAGTTSNSLFYKEPRSNEAGLTGKVNGSTGTWNGPDARHVVLLRRLANPYAPQSPTNPYVTVDYQSRVKVHDAVYKTDDAVPPSTPRPNPVQTAAIDNYRSTGRVQPFAGDETADVDAPVNTFNTTLTLESQTTPPGGAGTPRHSFFRHNAAADLSAGTPPAAPGDATLRVPFPWLVSMDRPLVNQLELLHVGATRPHELTHLFALPNATGEPLTHMHDLQHQGTTPGTNDGPLFQRDPATQVFRSPLYRALDLLQTKPWGHGLPLEGRTGGKVNINMIWDGDQTTPSKVFRAVLDSQAGNSFSAADVDTMWRAVVLSRSPLWTMGGAGVVGTTADELGATPTVTQFDRPFKGLGAGMFSQSAPSAGVVFPTAGALQTQFQAQPPGLEDTLLRRKVTPTAADTNPYPSNLPGLFQNPAAPVPGQPVHPYQQWEPLRKAFNSFTTTTDAYVLLVTVGFFEVVEENDPAGRPTRILRQEFYDDAPGDLRAQFVAVIDRTGLATDQNLPNQPQTAQQPWTLEVQNAVLNTDPAPRAELVGGFAVGTDPNAGTWNGTGNPPQATSEGTFNPGAADPSTTTPGFRRIAPTFQRGGGGAIIPNTPQTYTVTGTYDGQPIILTARFDPTNPTNPTTGTTKFWLGAGDRLEQVEAFFDGTEAGRWSYDPSTAALRVTVRPVQTPQLVGAAPLTLPHEGGGVASNVVFRNPGPQPSKTLKPGQTDAVVRMFAELK